jgi:hypothetical protein
MSSAAESLNSAQTFRRTRVLQVNPQHFSLKSYGGYREFDSAACRGRLPTIPMKPKKKTSDLLETSVACLLTALVGLLTFLLVWLLAMWSLRSPLE